jgi:hypothetical protein
MKKRRRLNLSLDEATYDILQDLRIRYGFRSACEMMAAFARILADSLRRREDRHNDLPDDDVSYIRSMFDELEDTMDVPDGRWPAYHKNGNRQAK